MQKIMLLVNFLSIWLAEKPLAQVPGVGVGFGLAVWVRFARWLVMLLKQFTPNIQRHQKVPYLFALSITTQFGAKRFDFG